MKLKYIVICIFFIIIFPFFNYAMAAEEPGQIEGGRGGCSNGGECCGGGVCGILDYSINPSTGQYEARICSGGECTGDLGGGPVSPYNGGGGSSPPLPPPGGGTPAPGGNPCGFSCLSEYNGRCIDTCPSGFVCSGSTGCTSINPPPPGGTPPVPPGSTPPPTSQTCAGCSVYDGIACVDDSSVCSNSLGPGYYCSYGACYPPASTPPAGGTPPPLPPPYIPPPPTPMKITGFVFIDYDNDGVYDTGEPGFNGANIGIIRNSTPIGIIHTAGEGIFRYNTYISATYRVELFVPYGYYPTTQTTFTGTLPPDRTVYFGMRATGLSCNQGSCIGDQDCLTSACYLGVCRNMFCPTEPSCSCSTTSTTPTPTGLITTPSPTPIPELSACQQACTSNSQCVTNFCLEGLCFNQYCKTENDCLCGSWTIDLKANGSDNPNPIPYNSSVDLSWTGNVNENCQIRSLPAHSQWTGYVAKVGSKTITNLTESTRFYIYCPTTGATDTILVTVEPFSSPTLTQTPTPTSLSSDLELIIVPPPGYTIKNSTISPGPNQYSGPNQNTVWFTSNQPQNVNFCISNTDRWYQSESGDVRFNVISNKVPPSRYASEPQGGSPPAVFFSSIGTSNFYSGLPNTNKWNINREYNSNIFSRTYAGSTSFTFYKTQAEKHGIPLLSLPSCVTSSTISCIPSPGGVFYYDGNLTLDGGSIPSGSSITLLINGSVTITNRIQVDNGGLLIVAAKETITINPSVGNDIVENSANQAALQGVYTAEENIVIDGTDGAGCPLSDRKLLVAGNIIANSGNPFTINNSGQLIINRSLCGNDSTYPVLKVYPRLDFLTQLSNYHKVKNRRWIEVNP